MTREQLPYYTVIVNEGSGCLFQPASNDYSYVLTAKHVLNDDIITIQRQTLDDDGNPIIEDIEIIGTPYIHPDSNKDAAIIKVELIDGIEGLLRDDLLAIPNAIYYLCGHPEARKSKSYSYRDNKLQIEQKQQHGYVEAELSRPALHHEIVGQSGGGVIKVEESCFLLAGIQKRMSVEDEVETLGRIEFSPLSFFDEIINQNEDDLTPLYPPYVVSFNRLVSEIFTLDNLIAKKSLIQNELSLIASQLCEDFSPEKILELFGDSLLSYNCNPSLINHKELWVSFLELLTINQLHSESKLTLDELVSIHKKRKLILVDTDEWTKKLEDIFRSDLSDVEKGGTVVVCATREKSTNKVEISSAELPLIDISVSLSEMNISNTVTNPFEDLKLTHLYKFQNHLINNVNAFRDANGINVKNILKDETKNIL
jgi:hypothetical protein